MKQIKKLIFSLFYKEVINLSSSNDLAQKVVIVTGGTHGIGASTVKVLSSEGANVVVISRNSKDLQQVFSPAELSKIHFIKADVTNEIDCKNVVAEVIKKFKKIDVLVNNVGVFYGNKIEAISEEDFTRVINTNIKSTFLMCKYVVPIMKKQKDGLIVNMGSKISHNTNVAPHMSLYAAVKYAIEGMSLALEKELKEFNIRVTCIMSATVNTVMSLDAKDKLSTYRVGQTIALLMKLPTVTFESIILKSRSQNI